MGARARAVFEVEFGDHVSPAEELATDVSPIRRLDG